MLNGIKLVDFNDLFVIAVGLSMAYVVFEGKRQSSFFHILSKITDTLKNWVLDKKTQSQQQEEAIIAKIDYYLKSGLLKDETKGALDLVSQKAKDVVNDVHQLESWSERKLNFHTKTDFLSIISYDCFLFGIFVLFIGVFQNKCDICIDGLIETMLLSILFLLVHCLWFERLEINRKWKKILGPGFILHSFILAVVLTWGIFNNETFLPSSINSILPICCVIACFIGFIAYLIMNIFSNFILAIIILVKIFLLKISANAKTHEKDMQRYHQELNDIDNTLQRENLSQSISITPDSICTSED